MDTATYLTRIGYQGSTQPSLENLMEIHRRHVLSVPFGSLGIHCGERITLELPALYRKIVGGRREGFCYEVNGLFSWLLGALGYEVALLSGRVQNIETQVFGPPYDHLILLVELEGRRWLCDVGFGNSFRVPLPLEDGAQAVQENGVFRLAEDQGTWLLQRSPQGSGCDRASEATLYKFTLRRRRLEDFAAMCEYQQTSPSSIFACKSFCSLHLPSGHLTYMGRRLIVTEYTADGERKATTELEEKEIPHVLKGRFGITLSNKLVPKDDRIVPQPQAD
ncbi:arylamine N-acetyltransferase, pineal gland isozyme NAT-3-like [Heterodontus francisci]|uniref:arylamine N-acetyltransferase, pineal gland isozyme NAT-3-like n=1 Tax=Heterodontus francisci TaxID=7792 RepID=UPI00355BD85F